MNCKTSQKNGHLKGADADSDFRSELSRFLVNNGQPACILRITRRFVLKAAPVSLKKKFQKIIDKPLAFDKPHHNQEYMYMYSLRVRVGVCCDRDQRVRDGPKAKVSNVRTTRESY